MRLFEARTYTNARVVLKEFLTKARRLAQRELEVRNAGATGYQRKLLLTR